VSSFLYITVVYWSTVKPGPHQQQCRSNVRLCCQKRQHCRTIFALKFRLFDKVERCFDIVASVDRALATKGLQELTRRSTNGYYSRPLVGYDYTIYDMATNTGKPAANRAAMRTAAASIVHFCGFSTLRAVSSVTDRLRLPRAGSTRWMHFSQSDRYTSIPYMVLGRFFHVPAIRF